MNLVVENLPDHTTPSDLAALFAPFAEVLSAHVGPGGRPCRPAATARLRVGPGWSAAVRRLHGADYRGRTLAVREVLTVSDPLWRAS